MGPMFIRVLKMNKEAEELERAELQRTARLLALEMKEGIQELREAGGLLEAGRGNKRNSLGPPERNAALSAL